MSSPLGARIEGKRRDKMAKSRSPYLTRFLSDFTLGFSDGLTVPFALTAGLSSLGRADTVISAGLAELCAGSISMGIGGYLAARVAAFEPRLSAVVLIDGVWDNYAAYIIYRRQPKKKSPCWLSYPYPAPPSGG